jgi:hypothetical protein
MSLHGESTIGDEWQAIRIIATTQLNPQKAIAELIENSLDAGAKHIHIVREKTRGEGILRILDDGRGAVHSVREKEVVLSDDVEANLAQIAQHICDSIKRKLDAQDRQKIVGEYGIGILGFWALGEKLVFRSRTARSDTYVLTMEREKRAFTVDKAKEPLERAGTEVTIRRLHDTTKRLVGGRRLANYLARELRGRLLETGAEIDIDDEFPGGGKIPVRPLPFSGESLSDLNEVRTQSGRLANLDLYMNFAATASEPAEVGLYRKGTRIVSNLTVLDDFQHEPWTLNVLEGKIEYSFLSTSPGTRTGVSIDEPFQELVLALKEIEAIIARRIKQRQKELRQERASEYSDFLKDAFKKVFKDLPDDYDFFKGPKAPPPPTSGPLCKVEIVPSSVAIVCGSGWRFIAEPMDENDYSVREGLIYAWKLSPEIGKYDVDKKNCELVAGSKPGESVLSVEVRQGQRVARSTATVKVVEQERCGELSRVEVLPRVAVVCPGYSRNLTAICTDDQGIHIPSVTVRWLCPTTHGTFSSTAGSKSTFQAKSDAPLGPMPIKVVVKATNKQMEGSATLYVQSLRSIGDKFPPYAFLPEPLSPLRSQWDSKAFQLKVNNEHPDYKRAKQEGTDLSYIGMLYAKELVFMNFGKTSSPIELLERLVEVQTRLFPFILRELKN